MHERENPGWGKSTSNGGDQRGHTTLGTKARRPLLMGIIPDPQFSWSDRNSNKTEQWRYKLKGMLWWKPSSSRSKILGFRRAGHAEEDGVSKIIKARESHGDGESNPENSPLLKAWLLAYVLLQAPLLSFMDFSYCPHLQTTVLLSSSWFLWREVATHYAILLARLTNLLLRAGPAPALRWN